MSQIPLVLQLQELATKNQTDITELLRKALLVATKLGLQQFRDWINQELHGYTAGEIPEYRQVNAELKARNPYHGLIPFIIDDRNLMETICLVSLQSPIGAMVDLLKHPNERGCYLEIPFTHNQKIMLMRLQGSRAILEPVRTVSQNQVASIIDTVRTAILEWSLRLESDGVIGQGLTFSSEEKRRAQSSITIENFQGVIGDIFGSNVTLNLQMTVKKNDLASLKAYLARHGVDEHDIHDLERAIIADTAPVSRHSFGKNVSEWVGRLVTKAATGAWEIGINAAGGILSEAISSYYGL